jgi:hypothetical protein
MVVMKGAFRGRRRPRSRRGTEEQWYSYAFQNFIFDLDTGKITDSGSSQTSPDFSLLVEVVTDRGVAD